MLKDFLNKIKTLGEEEFRSIVRLKVRALNDYGNSLSLAASKMYSRKRM